MKEDFDISEAEDVLLICLRVLQADIAAGGKLSNRYMRDTKFWDPERLRKWCDKHLEDLSSALNFGDLYLEQDEEEPSRQRAGIVEPDSVTERSVESTRNPAPKGP